MRGEPVKIIEFQAENVKRVKAVLLTPAASGLTTLGGNNNQGKTSILDAIAWTLGGEKFRPDSAARDGAVAPPYMKATLSNGMVVERKGKNSTLTVTDPSGRRAGQQLLNEFVEQLALDLPRFMEAGDREKADTLLKIIGVGDRLAAIDREIKSLYDRRTVTGQIASQKQHFADEMPEYPDAPDQPLSAADLIRQQQDVLARNGENQRKRQQAASLVVDCEKARSEIEILEIQMQELNNKLESKRDDMRRLLSDLETAQKSAADLQDESTAELEAALRDIEETNRKVRANMDKARAMDEARHLTDEYETLTGQISDARKRRTALLDGADLPLKGLSVEEGSLTYNGKHWGDMSGSDQLRVATAIVRRLNPDCGFVLLDKLEQMDIDTLQSFGTWLEAEGLQAIATRVSTGGECQIIIEDGRILGQDFVQESNAVSAAEPSWKKGAF